MKTAHEIVTSQPSGAVSRTRDRWENWKAYLLLPVLLVAALIMPHGTRSQTSAASTAPPPVPQRTVYGQLFKHVVFLDHLADLADQSGKNGSQYRNFYQNRAKLTSAETAALKLAAKNASSAVQAVETQIQTQIKLLRPQFVGVKPSAKNPVVTPPIFKTLQAQKDAAILNQVSALQTAMGANRFQQFDAIVQALITPHIKVTTAATPRQPGVVGTAPLPPAMPGR